MTSPLRTVLDCARTLPFGWGLAVADSALRQRLVLPHHLDHVQGAALGRGAAPVRRVLRHADGRSGSPLESLLRALLIERGIGPLTPQARLFPGGHPYDLSIAGARVLIEADGAEHHREHARFTQDCEDSTIAAREDHVLLRVTWYDVTRGPSWTADAVRRAVDRQRLRLQREDAGRRRTAARRRIQATDAHKPRRSA